MQCLKDLKGTSKLWGWKAAKSIWSKTYYSILFVVFSPSKSSSQAMRWQRGHSLLPATNCKQVMASAPKWGHPMSGKQGLQKNWFTSWTSQRNHRISYVFQYFIPTSRFRVSFCFPALWAMEELTFATGSQHLSALKEAWQASSCRFSGWDFGWFVSLTENCEYGGFRKMWVPKIDGLYWKIPLKRMIGGYPCFRKPPCTCFDKCTNAQQVKSVC